jgi:hypothetical protein
MPGIRVLQRRGAGRFFLRKSTLSSSLADLGGGRGRAGVWGRLGGSDEGWRRLSWEVEVLSRSGD